MAGTLARLARQVNRVLPYGWRVVNVGAPLANVARPGPPYAYLTPDSAIVTLHDGHLLYVDPQDQSVSAHLIARGAWEFWVEQAVRALVREGDRVVEVGANVGYFTIIMARLVGPAGRITSFEANPHLAELVRRSLLLNGYAGWTDVRAEAAADICGEIEFFTSPEMNGGGHIGLLHEGEVTGRTPIRAPAVTLDSALADGPVHLLRMDAEGAEPLVLAGARELIARSPDLRLCMEWDVMQMGSRKDPGATVALLSDAGFRFWRIETSGRLEEVAAGALPGLPHSDLVVSRQGPPLRR
jgi:FkbM family methyltransferase